MKDGIYNIRLNEHELICAVAAIETQLYYIGKGRDISGDKGLERMYNKLDAVANSIYEQRNAQLESNFN